MKLKRPLLVLFLLTVTGILAFKTSFDPIDKALAALEQWAANNPQEKVYLHTDKPYYLVGDTIWFKAYVTIGAKHQLSALSGALYVDLFNESDSLTEALKLPVIAGMAKGDFVLADSSMRDGNYRIRAYTQWMRNAGPDYFYDKVFHVGNSIANPVFTAVNYEYTKNGSATNVTAVIRYVDDKGAPYASKPVTYDLIENGNSQAAGKAETDATGEIKIALKPGKTGGFTNTHLATNIEIAKEEHIRKSFPIKSVAMESDIQFFPESGPLIGGIRSRVAFKAIGRNGKGIDVKGVITDSENKEVSEFESSHLGMGYFQLMPEAGKQYTAKVTYGDGSENSVKLPAVQASGFNLAVYHQNESDTILVRIRTTPEALQGGEQHVGLVAQYGGTVFLSTDIAVNKPMITIPVPAKTIPSGILQFTLFSANGTATNERITFVQHDDQLSLKLNTPKQTYGAREKVEVSLDATGPEGQPQTGRFSVSVINENATPTDEASETTIFSELLLTSDLKGYVEQPNYYFANPNDETRANLDILMMTQGYRRFVWKDLLGGKPMAPAIKPEKLTTEVSGQLFNLGNKPIDGGTVILMSNKGNMVIDTTTDAQGRFKFDNLLITSGISFTVQGRNAKGGNKVELKLDKTSSQVQTPNPNIGDLETDFIKSFTAALENSKKQESDLLKRGMLGRTLLLKEVKIKARRRWSNSRAGGIYNIPEGHADQTIKPEAGDQFKDVLEFLTMRVSTVSFRMEDSGDCGTMMIPYSRGERMIIILNGRKLSTCENLSLYEDDPSNIVKVDVVRTNQALLNMIGGTAALIVTTKYGGYKSSNDFSIKYHSPQGFNNAKEFYSPVYKNDGTDPQVADLRSTIYWNPSVVTTDGKAKFDFFNADSPGSYRVVVEGINADGLLGRQTYHYEVK